MICHTVCANESCKNFTDYKNNIQYFEQSNRNRLVVKVDKSYERGLYVGNKEFKKGEFIAIYNGMLSEYDVPQSSNVVMDISSRYTVDAANPNDNTIPV